MKTKTKPRTEPHDPLPASLDVLLHRPQVCRAIGVSPRTLSKMIAKQEFPRPEKLIARKDVWRTSTVNAWIQTTCAGGA